MIRNTIYLLSFLLLLLPTSYGLETGITLTSADGSFTLETSEDIPNLSESVYPNLNWTDGENHRVCANGTWMFYTGENYTNEGSDFLYAHNRTSCTSYWSSRPMLSMRRAGLDNSLEDAATLFTSYAFTGEKHVFTEDVPNIEFSFVSIAVNGDVDYSFYPQPYYIGCPLCVRRAFVRDTNAYGRPPGTLKSMKKGCVCPIGCIFCSEA